ncbi:hypothetical protein EDC63_10819 [Sulfurirhabdus autotrophica]|uniref:Uncharacterized protein n=2 Tax=Sulfurirhabdus autotrophica TaxID=1706046 RepID=A0A4R3Y384_9PROT|nr:hypothetical protein EDC63_10819 [Sulfurirhabdus autotrophica]
MTHCTAAHIDPSRKRIISQSRRDLEFICKQILRFLKMPHKELFAHYQKNRHDAFCTIPHPDGKGQLQCGSLAWEKFGKLAGRVFEFEPTLAQRVSEGRVMKEVIDAFVQRVLREHQEIDQITAEQILVDAAGMSSQALQTTEHYLPCVLFLHGKPDEFSIGPVTFVRRKKFFQNKKQVHRRSVEAEIAAHIEHVDKHIEQGFSRERAATVEQSRHLVRGLHARAIKTYRGYPWIAKVQIINCDHEVSEKLAAKAIETALNVIRILLGAERTRRLRLAWSRGDALRTAGMWADAQDMIHVQTGLSSIGPVGFENWYEGLTQGSGHELQILGSALAPLVDPREITHLHERFVDAINWFGDAATDTESTASVVKYVSAIERLFFGKFDRGHKTEFASRIKIVCNLFGYEDGGQAYEDALQVYNARSALLHGDLSPRDKKSQEIALLAEELSRRCILCSTHLYPMMLAAYKNPDAETLEMVMKKIGDEGLDWLAKAANYTKASDL